MKFVDPQNSPKPIQAGDYGKKLVKSEKQSEKITNANTDGRKTLALWSS